MVILSRSNSENTDYQALTQLLDAYLRIQDGEEHAFYAQYNKSTTINEVIVVYENAQALACGALKAYSPEVAEIKRMYVLPTLRGQGVATLILKELESWAKELGYTSCILETGKRQPEAIALYLKNGYQIVPNYGQYLHAENSVCFEKKLA